jgi:hypothetical protein
MRAFPTQVHTADAQPEVFSTNPSKEDMATSSILGGARPPEEPTGTDIDSLGPSDTSDSGSDVRIARERTAVPADAAAGAIPIAHDSSTDAAGTGERASADSPASQADADILPDSMEETGELADTDEGEPEDADAGEDDRD